MPDSVEPASLEHPGWQPGWAWRCACLASLALHLALAGLVWWAWYRAPLPTPARTLNLQLMGLMAARQVEHQEARARPQPQSRPPAPRPAPNPARAVAPSDVVVAARPPAPAVSEPVAAPMSTATAPPADTAQVARAQQAIATPQDEQDALHHYLLGLRQAIQRRLHYPPDAQSAGYVGAPVIRFTLTEDGEIQPGTLAIRRSSGYALLDEQALLAAQSSVPLARPPRRMNIAIAIDFAQDPQ